MHGRQSAGPRSAEMPCRRVPWSSKINPAIKSRRTERDQDLSKATNCLFHFAMSSSLSSLLVCSYRPPFVLIFTQNIQPHCSGAAKTKQDNAEHRWPGFADDIIEHAYRPMVPRQDVSDRLYQLGRQLESKRWWRDVHLTAARMRSHSRPTHKGDPQNRERAREVDIPVPNSHRISKSE